MRTALTLVLLLALICLLHRSSAQPSALRALHQQCCRNTTRTPIPRGKIQNVVRSHSDCNLRGIIVTTVCNSTVCLADGWKFAEKLLADFEKSTADRKTPSAPFNVFPCDKKSNKL